MKLALVLALALSAFAFDPAAELAENSMPEDTHVPMTIMVETEVSADDASFSEAQSMLQSMGKDACVDLAKSTEESVRANVRTQQDLLWKIEKGKLCPNEGQQAIASAKSQLKKAEATLASASKHYTVVQTATFDFGQYSFNKLTKGKCANVF